MAAVDLPEIPSGDSQAVLSAFNSFRENLDHFYDKREVLVKLSRDITNLSKKVIFQIHRLATDPNQPATPEEDVKRKLKAAKKAYEALEPVKGMWEGIGRELQGEDFWRFQRSMSPGLQEFIEAYGFAFYLEHNLLVPYTILQTYLSNSSGEPFFPLPYTDYLLGISDLTGELMRFAISSIAARGGWRKAREICVFVRNCRAGFEALSPNVKGLQEKQKATTTSLRKIEDAAYAISIREQEYSASPEHLEELVRQYVSGYGRDQGGGGGDDYDD